MSTALIYDKQFELHLTGPGHPERPQRLAAIYHRLHGTGQWNRLVHLDFAPASWDVIERVHEGRYLQRLRDACGSGMPFIDCPDSTICTRSAEIASLAVGGVLEAVDAVMEDRVGNAFCAVRPPGHHAEAGFSMGFCLLNNVAIAACHALDRHGLQRVAIVDFDVHHGNGTQHAFERRDDVLFISLHEDPEMLYPGSGRADETGLAAGEGYTLNIPMLPGSGDGEYDVMFRERVVPALDEYRPQFLFVSAGFDAASADPLAHMELTQEGFRAMTDQLTAAAARHCGGRMASVLEGGYDLPSLSDAVEAHVGSLLAMSTIRR